MHRAAHISDDTASLRRKVSCRFHRAIVQAVCNHEQFVRHADYTTDICTAGTQRSYCAEVFTSCHVALCLAGNSTHARHTYCLTVL